MAEITIPVARKDQALYLVQEAASGSGRGWDRISLSSTFGLGGATIVVDLRRGDERRRYVIDGAEILHQVTLLANETPHNPPAPDGPPPDYPPDAMPPG